MPLPQGQGSFLPIFLPTYFVAPFFLIVLMPTLNLTEALRSCSVRLERFRSSILQLVILLASDHLQSMTIRSSSCLVSIAEMAFSRQMVQSHAEKTELMKRLIATSSSAAAGISIIELPGIALGPEIRAEIETSMSSRVSDPKSRSEQAARRRPVEWLSLKRAEMILSKATGLFCDMAAQI